MAEIVRMPKLSDTMTEGVVAAWHKKAGDVVKVGELLAEIETDKATMEFESFQEGVLLHIGVEKGQAAPVDSILCILGKKNEDISTLIENEKQRVIPKPQNGTLPLQPAVEAASAPTVVLEKPPVLIVPEPATVVQHNTLTDGKSKASPLAKRLAKEKGISIGALTGSGDGGRVVKRDIENYSGIAAAGIAGIAVSAVESYCDEPVSQMRKTIARRLAESKFTSPHFYLTIEIAMDKAIEARQSILDFTNTKISFNDIVIKAAAAALRKHPKVNASWIVDAATGQAKIRYKQHIHIGVAVAVEEGLLVPVVKFAENKTLTQIAGEVKAFAEKAKNKKLQPEEMQGNTFTVSNLGMFGIEQFTAIINPPDACILAVGGIKQVAIVKNGQIIPGNVMKVTLSCDHRVVDGATGAAFLQTFKQLIENPIILLGTSSI